MKAKIIGINRHRILTDGAGITTLIGFYGCNLKCKYCLNPHSLSDKFEPELIETIDLIERVRVDDFYFRETDGGICFTGGEPLLNSSFIKDFRQKCPSYWKITIETSLNVDLNNLIEIIDATDEFIIDIKDLNPKIYKLYTGLDNERVITNLKYIKHNYKGNIKIRIPSIPRYNNYEDLEYSCKTIQELGFNYTQLDYLTYITSRKDHHLEPYSLNGQDDFIYLYKNPELTSDIKKDKVSEEKLTYGKAVCCVLKSIRNKVAERENIPSHNDACRHKGNCLGTCPRCEFELNEISQKTNYSKFNNSKKLFSDIIESLSVPIKTALTTHREQPGTSWVTEGMCPRPEIYCAARGPLQGDINTQGIEMPALNTTDEEELDFYYEEKYGLKLPPPPPNIEIII